MKKIEAVIFDWAGTTVDYGSVAPVKAFADAFAEFGIIPTMAEVREPMGMLKWDHIHTMMEMPRITEEWKKAHNRMWDDKDVDRIYEKSESIILSTIEKYATPKPFVSETVDELRKRGVKIGSTTGYTSEMMNILTVAAEKQGYRPDCCFCPNDTDNIGRPYPYMVFRNIETLGISDVNNVIKVGDTVADIKEGKNAGLFSIGIIEGSSIMGYSEAEYSALSNEKKVAEVERVRKVYSACGADYVINNMGELLPLIEKINNR